MSRLVVVSNRVAPIVEGKTAAGGLAVAVLSALKEDGGIWFGWNGEIVASVPSKPDLMTVDNLTYATFGMTRRDYNEYYSGFSNSALWPLFHYRLDLAKFRNRDLTGYLRVNGRFAKSLAPMLRVDDTIWVHDYHLIPLAEELRKTGASHPMGFFLHTPLPPLEILVALPHHEDIMKALCAYDLVGFQTVNDLAAFHDYVVLEANGEVLADGIIKAFGRTLRAEAFPIGIDTKEIIALSNKQANSPERSRLEAVLRDREMIIGVDRLDYSKGLVERFRSFERLLELNPRIQGHVTLMQIAPPSRSDVGGYDEIRTNLETTAGNVNGRFADFDWVPIRYLNKSFERSELTCFYRAAKVGLVTPLRDGMNLVAKEYVAAQATDNPGVLVLSRFAGAAHELDGALRVNPYDTDEVANAMNQALEMPLEERIERHSGMLSGLLKNNVHDWRRKFLAALQETQQQDA
ncbi:MAG: alpha,alpha-trehalose-phosphate synthase (UDP-forming) [Rhodospirillaceae bacterium]|nr:alpha,alpha-trehalose-phosphate synthase (UDP-forming) [Rhodospirillaceae bacterium]